MKWEKTEQLETQNGNGLTRRNFLSSIAVGATAVAGASLLGACSNGGAASASNTGGDHTWDKEADVVVVGYGGGGAAAAIEAKKAGASVLVLERTSKGGGSTAMAAGILYMGGGTGLQTAMGFEDTRDDMYKYLTTAAGVGCNEELIGLFCDKSIELYDWCVESGIQFPKEYTEGYAAASSSKGLTWTGGERNADNARIAKPAPRGHKPGESGEAVFGPLSSVVDSLGVEIQYGCEVNSLILDDEGRVLGIEAKEGSKTIAVKAAKGVVLTTGGWIMNNEMVAAYCPQAIDAAFKLGTPDDVGTGIKMAQEIGADLTGMSKPQYSIPLYAYGDDMLKGILVNTHGRRFISEDYYSGRIAYAILSSQGRVAYEIIDSKVSGAVSDSFGGNTIEPIATGNTIAELAENMNISPDVLSATVDFYNQCVDKGVDEEWEKSAKFLAKIDSPPYSAFELAATNTSYCTTCGGVKIDKNAQVIAAENSKPIQGLYAAGRVSCAIFGDYMGSGASIAETLTFGRIAGQQAASAEAWG